MNYNYLLVVLSIFQFSFLSSINAQDRYVPIPKPMAPEEMSNFAKHDFSNVNTSTGIANIQVPLYEIQQDGFTFPLSIFYNTKGIKVNEEASFIGLGWNFTFPTLMQRVNDEDDLNRFSDPFYEGYLLPHQGNTSPFIKQLEFNSLAFTWTSGTINLQSTNNPITETCDYYLATSKEVPMDGIINYTEGIHFSTAQHPIPDIFYASGYGVDTEPDYFSLNILGENVNFMFDIITGEIKSLNTEMYKIEYIQSSEKFKVTGADEVVYIYGNKHQLNTSMTSYTFDTRKSFGSTSYNSEWLLEKIITSKGSEINFEYEVVNKNINNQTGGVNPNYLGWYVTEKEGVFNLSEQDPASTGAAMAVIADDSPHIVGSGSGGKTADKFYSLDNQYYLKKIVFDYGEVNFGYSLRSDVVTYQNSQLFKKLSNISVSDIQGVDKIIYDFNYGSFVSSDQGYIWRDNIASNDLIRLKLNSIDKNGEAYRKFEYNSLNLPAKSSYATDYWGYYNGVSNNTSYVPNLSRFQALGIVPLTYDSYTNSSNHSPNSNNHSSVEYYAKASILQKIIYPTSGYQEFHYELNKYNSTAHNKVPNSYSSTSDTEISGVGLRVSEIELFDNNSQLLKRKKYNYSDGILPNHLNFFKSYSTSYVNQHNSNFFKSNYDGLICSQKSFQFDTPLFEKDNIVYYRNSEEIFEDFEYETNSFSVLREFSTTPYIYFTNNAINVSNFWEVYNPGLINRSLPSNGTLLNKKEYSASGVLLKETQYNYLKKKSELFYGVTTRYVGTWWEVDWVPDPPVLLRTPRHSISYYPIYYDVDYVSSINTIEYFNEGNISTLNEKEYDQLWRLKKDKYSYDDGDFVESSYYYDNNFLIGKPTKILTAKNHNNNISFSNINFNYSSTYNSNNSNSAYALVGEEICPKTLQVNDENCTSVEYFYDIPSVKLKESKNGDESSSSYLWGYNSQYPIAKFENISFSELAGVLGISEANLMSLDETDLPTINGWRDNPALAETMITTYTYEPLIGMTSQTDPRGYTTYYEYDSFNRLKVIRDAEENKIKEYSYKFGEEIDSGNPPPPPPPPSNYTNFSVSVVSSDYLSPLPPNTCPTSICVTGGALTKSIQLSVMTTAPGPGVQLYVNGNPATSNNVAAEWGTQYSNAGIKWVRFYSTSSNVIWDVDPGTGIIQGASQYECGTTNCN